MNTFKSIPTLKAIKSTFGIKTGILEVSESNLNFCRHEDDAVIVQIGWVTNNGFDIDAELVEKVTDIHTKLNRYFEGGCHGGISMLVLSLDSKDEGYRIYGDDTDGECEPVEAESQTLSGLIDVIDKLN
jgi:hypothetical protein